MASSFSQKSILFHYFHLCLVELFSEVLCRLSRMYGIIWKLTEKPLFEVSPRGNLSRLKVAKSPSNRYVVQALLYYTFRVFCSSFNMFTAQFIYNSIQLLEITEFLSSLQVIDIDGHMLANCTVGRNLERRLVSIAVWWPLLPLSRCQ